MEKLYFLLAFMISHFSQSFEYELTFNTTIDDVEAVKGKDLSLICDLQVSGNRNSGSFDYTPSKAFWSKVFPQWKKQIFPDDNHRTSVDRKQRYTWILHIKSVEFDDHGLYLCQLNTTPRLSKFYNVMVAVPEEIIFDYDEWLRSAKKHGIA